MYAVVRVRSGIKMKPDIKKTLQMLRLTRVNHCVLLEENKVYKGMLQIVKDYVTYGEIDKNTLSKLITLRGRLLGDKPITEEYIQSSTPFKTLDELSNAIMDNSFKYMEIPDVKPLFRLSPPRKGYISIKRPYKIGGALGYRGTDINKLIQSML
ncbi:MAG: 50S ribosomal protein L30 [Candidatus Thermoplasmatota archaeon]